MSLAQQQQNSKRALAGVLVSTLLVGGAHAADPAPAANPPSTPAPARSIITKAIEPASGKETDPKAPDADPGATNPGTQAPAQPPRPSGPAEAAKPTTDSSKPSGSNSTGIQATATGAGWEGVTVRYDTGPEKGKYKIISWDRRGPDRPSPTLDSGVPASWPDEVWRASSRLSRGDLPAADALFESLFESNQARSAARSSGGSGEKSAADAGGPTSAVVAEGTLRCRLAKGAQAGSLVAFMEWIRCVRRGPATIAGVWSDPIPDSAEWIGGRLGERASDARIRPSDPDESNALHLNPLMDPGTGLVAELPPIFVPEPALLALAESDQWKRYRDQTGAGTPPGKPSSGAGGARPSLGELSGWYLAAIRFEAGRSVERPVIAGSGGQSGEGMRLLRDIVVARIGDANERDAARTALRSRYVGVKTEPPAWLEAWCRCAVGRSLIVEEDPATKRRGVLELLYLPAAFSTQSPYLAGVALANASAAMNELGETGAAGVLARELRARFPDHPANNWEALRAIPTP